MLVQAQYSKNHHDHTQGSPRNNLLTNGSFDSNGQGWNPDGANFDENRCNLPRRSPAAVAYHNLPIQVTAGRKYLIETQFHTSNPGGSFNGYIQIVHSGGSGAVGFPISQNGLMQGVYPAQTSQTITFQLHGGTNVDCWFDDVSMTLIPESEELLKNGDFTDYGEHWVVSNPEFDGQGCIFKPGATYVSQIVEPIGTGLYILDVDVTATPMRSTGLLQISLLGTTETHTFNYDETAVHTHSFAVSSAVTGIEIKILRGVATGSEDFIFNKLKWL
jgi:hypothetical protein